MIFNQTALDALEDEGIPFLFLTGKAGTGKSTLVRHWMSQTKKRVVKLAPTGLAAMQIGGTTIHKFFRLVPPRPYYRKNDMAQTKVAPESFDVILIDEVSMVRSDIMQVIYNTLTYSDTRQRPWGGKLIRVVGDLSQLPPVVADRPDISISAFLRQEFGGHYFFNAGCFAQTPIDVLELTQVYRQSDARFLNLLDFMRSVEKQERLAVRLQQVLCERLLPADSNAIWLTTTKARAAQINSEYMKLLNAKAYTLRATIEGKINAEDVPVEAAIELKRGCTVMIRANENDYLNGEMGVFEGFEDVEFEYFDAETKQKESVSNKCLVIRTQDKIKYVKQYSWQSIDYEQDKHFNLKEKIVGTFSQYPVAPAYAITIHKSQGLTLDRIHIDFERGCFSPGQAYVAFSRCKTLEGITLQVPARNSDFQVDPTILTIEKYARKAS